MFWLVKATLILSHLLLYSIPKVNSWGLSIGISGAVLHTKVSPGSLWESCAVQAAPWLNVELSFTLIQQLTVIWC